MTSQPNTLHSSASMHRASPVHEALSLVSRRGLGAAFMTPSAVTLSSCAHCVLNIRMTEASSLRGPPRGPEAAKLSVVRRPSGPIPSQVTSS